MKEKLKQNYDQDNQGKVKQQKILETMLNQKKFDLTLQDISDSMKTIRAAGKQRIPRKSNPKDSQVEFDAFEQNLRNYIR